MGTTYSTISNECQHLIGSKRVSGSPPKLHRLYTWGYSGSKPLDLLSYQRALNATVCDIRFSPRSRVPFWNSGAIKGILPDARYFYMIELGNINYKNDLPIELYKPQEAVRDIELILTYHPAILLCGCADWHTCHRRTAAEYLARELGVEVAHLPGRFTDWRNHHGGTRGVRGVHPA
jgi:hypothetical protein